ncbi:hypothetical protein [Caldalkalibacillus mannanilyticus]|uniref:hypothetical protein n=1 Tax=Caldalkalibacillus mannanilyticus TaxID=1418 RepID=UPI00046A92BE|nr:hypothetical protein [Caldalkalibacillus mannanilyticus]
MNKVSIALILFLLFGGAMYVMNLTGGEKRELGYGGEQLSSFYSLKELPEDFEIVELSDGSWDFISAGQLVVGGLRLMNEETMIEKTSNPILFEKLYPQDFPYPAVKTLEHIKSQGIAQIIHYYILHDKDHVYHLYFYTPFFSKERAEEVARSFQID